jgi:hypothetical protein
MSLKSSLENMIRKHSIDKDLAKSVNIKLSRWELISRSTTKLREYVANIVVLYNKVFLCSIYKDDDEYDALKKIYKATYFTSID